MPGKTALLGICDHCGGPFPDGLSLYASHGNPRRYCSAACNGKARRALVGTRRATEADLTTHETKATRMMVIYRLRIEGHLSGISDAELGEALGVDRTTIWKDKEALKLADKLYSQVMGRAPWDDRMTIHEAAVQLGCGEDTIRAMARDGVLRGAKIYNGRWRIPKGEIERMLR
jgi:excisionase family DNA binding protein